MEKKRAKRKYRFLRILGRIFLGLAILLILLLLFIRSPWGQGIIKDQVISYLSNKTGTEVQVERLFITFTGNIFLEGIYLEDTKGDTLVYSRELEASVPLLPIIRGKELAINSVDWQGVRANIIRQDSLEGFNFQFLIDAFAAPDTVATPVDTTSASMNIRIGKVNLEDFDVVFNDGVGGIESRVQMERLHLEMEETDLDNMRFHVGEVQLSNTVLDLKQTGVSDTTQTEDSEAQLPYLRIDELELENIAANYESPPSGMAAEVLISHFLLKLPEADLVNNRIHVSQVALHDSDFWLNLTQTEASPQQEEVVEVIETPEEAIAGFQWPDWDITVEDIDFQNNSLTYLSNQGTLAEGVFNPEAIGINALNFKAQDLYLQNETVGFDIEALNFKESSGLDLQEFQLRGQLNNENFNIEDLVVHLNQNVIEGELNLNYQSIQELMDNPEASSVQVDLSRFRIDIADVFLFQPDLRTNPYLLNLSRKPLAGNISASGTLASVAIHQARLNWGSATSIQARGRLGNLTQPDHIRFDFPSIVVASRNGDLRNIVDEDQFNMRLPDDLQLNGSATGSLAEAEAQVELLTSSGNVLLNGNFSNLEDIAFAADMQIMELQLGPILQNEQLGALNMHVTASGAGSSVNDLDADLLAVIDSFAFNDYAIVDLQLLGEFRDGRGPVGMTYADENLDVVLESMVFLDSVSPQVNLNLDLVGANLGNLGITQQDIRIAMELDGSFRGNMDSFDLNAEVEDGIAVYDQESYLLGDVGISGRVRPDSTAMDITGQILDLHLRSNTDPASFATALNRHYSRYLSDQVEVDSVVKPVNLQLVAEIREHPFLNEIFLPALEEMDTITIDVDFQERERRLTGLVDIPFLNYLGNEIDSLRLDVDSDRQDLWFKAGFNGLNAGPVAIQETFVEGMVADQVFHFDFSSMYQDAPLVQVKSELSQRGDTLIFSLDPADVLLNANRWDVPQDNEIRIAQNAITFNNFRLSRMNQLMELTHQQTGIEKEHIAVHFENFQLSSLLRMLNPEEQLVAGSLQGNFIVEDPYGTTGMIADLDIDQLQLFQVELGNLELDAEAVGSQEYVFDLAVKGGNADLDLTGDYVATQTGPELNAHLALNQLNMNVLEGFAMGALRDTEGSLTGDFEISGSMGETQYQGYLQFNDARFNVSMLNAPFALNNQRVQLDQDGFYFDNFTLEDASSNRFSVNGEVLTESMLNPEFNLELQARDFMAMNSSEDDNDLFYGQAVFDLDAEITGSLAVPLVDLTLNVGSDTDLTYIIPESQVAIESREGVVLFVNKENPDDILTATEEESFTFTGMDISAILSVEQGAAFNVIIDEQTGDNLQITGVGDFNFNIQTNGRTTLSGAYELSGGHYEMNLYGVVNRRFEIVEGSRITWGGDIFDASLDMRARYSVETSASALMAAQTSGTSASQREPFKQVLPFEVYLNVGGELMQPQLSFGLDMPEEEQGAIGGQVYSRIQQVNQQEAELNKQVFSLLVLNRFYPEPGSDGSGGGAMAMARDNLNNALSDQLNMISGNLLGSSGFALDFGLDSYTDYQGESPEERTQLDITAEKSFMDERLVVRVGSEVDIQGSNQAPGASTPLIGNVSIDYLITEEGQWRIRGFRRNRFENVIEGQIIASGLALIFTREFNEFRELWDSFRQDLEEDEQEE